MSMYQSLGNVCKFNNVFVLFALFFPSHLDRHRVAPFKKIGEASTVIAVDCDNGPALHEDDGELFLVKK